MNANIKAYKRSKYIISSIIIVIGVLLAVFSSVWVKMISIVFSMLFLSLSITSLINYLISRKYTNQPNIKLTVPIVLFIISFFCFINPYFVISFISNILGFCILPIAVYDFVRAKQSAEYTGKSYIFKITRSIINILFAFVLIFFPVTATQYLFIILAIYLIYLGIAMAVNVYRSEYFIYN